MSRQSLLVACLLLLAGVCAPQSVHASCGDWLAHPGGVVVADASDASGVLPPGSKPCDGPLCRQNPIGPTSVPVPKSPNLNRYHHDAICLADCTDAVDRLQTRRCVEQSLDLPVGYSAPIERPPKAS